jgi:hypothetical protein
MADDFAELFALLRGATGAARLATVLDQEMLEGRGVEIASRVTPDAQLPEKAGVDVFAELGGRFLVRYLLKESLPGAIRGTAKVTYVTPTPYSPKDAVELLMLPAEDRTREHAMLLDPRGISVVLGPRWVQGGFGIEYILPRGYTREAIAVRPWSLRMA